MGYIDPEEGLMGQAGRDLATEKEAADNMTVGPGVVATKSQARGALGGVVVGVIVGAIIGLIIGAIIPGQSSLVIAPIVFAIAGGVAVGVFGGIFNSQSKRERSAADV